MRTTKFVKLPAVAVTRPVFSHNAIHVVDPGKNNHSVEVPCSPMKKEDGMSLRGMCTACCSMAVSVETVFSVGMMSNAKIIEEIS